MYPVYGSYSWQGNGYFNPQLPYLNNGKSYIPYSMETKLKDLKPIPAQASGNNVCHDTLPQKHSYHALIIHFPKYLQLPKRK